LNQRFENAFEHRFRPLKHFVIPESDDAKPTACQKLRAFEIIEQTFRMLSAIELDDESRSHAYEVRDVSANRYLPPKSIATQAPMPQVIPKATFRVGGIRAQRASICEK
jgi:hypothetical protein